MTSWPPPGVLVVDDNDLLRALLRHILREGGYRVLGEARNGVMALELAERLRPDIVCMDLLMPEMDGLEALQTVKAMHPEMIVVLLADTPSADNVREAIRGGASGFIIKPFNAGKVLDTVAGAWQSARRHASNQESV